MQTFVLVGLNSYDGKDLKRNQAHDLLKIEKCSVTKYYSEIRFPSCFQYQLLSQLCQSRKHCFASGVRFFNISNSQILGIKLILANSSQSHCFVIVGIFLILGVKLIRQKYTIKCLAILGKNKHNHICDSGKSHKSQFLLGQFFTSPLKLFCDCGYFCLIVSISVMAK